MCLRKIIRTLITRNWGIKCRFLFCCLCVARKHQNSYKDIARIFNNYFQDLDILPSDVAASLALLREFQRAEREMIVDLRPNDTYEFLCGVPITSKTKLLTLTEDGDDLKHLQAIRHYMNFAFAAYNWSLFVMTSSVGFCQRIRCCCCPCLPLNDRAEVIGDNCCKWNYTALRGMIDTNTSEVVYATFHNDVHEPQFYVAIDYVMKKIVISIRGSASIQDMLTDVNGDFEVLPLTPPREDWLGHKGMIIAAEYIRKNISEKNLINRAHQMNIDKGTNEFGLVVVGHSLGAGTAAILAILLRQEYPDLICIAYSPPGGLLSMPAQQYSQEFITTVVVGYDLVPRVGLRQMENLRADLKNVMERRVDSKWKTIACSTMCGCCSTPTSVANMKASGSVVEYQRDKELARVQIDIPDGTSVSPMVHIPLYPPGNIIHVVRYHPHKGIFRKLACRNKPVYQAIWASPEDFYEILISPNMFADHSTDNVRYALNKVSSRHKKFEHLANKISYETNINVK